MAAAKAFVRHYIELLNYAMTTGDTARLRQAADRCQGCDAYAKLYEEEYEDGGFYRSRGWSVESLFVVRQSGDWTALLDVHAARLVHARTEKATPRTFPPDDYSLRFELTPEEQSWAVTEFRGEG